MKYLLLLLTFVGVSQYSFSQYSRSFYLHENNTRRQSELIEINGDIHLLSIRESSTDTLCVTMVALDDEGETTEYRKFTLTPFAMDQAFAISGAGVNASGNPVICMNQSVGGGQMKVQYITLDLNGNAISSVNEMTDTFKNSCVQSRVKGDSLISYFGTQIGSQKIDRVATSMSNTSNFTIELANDSLVFNGGSLNTANRRLDLLIDGSDEYIHFGTYIIKRSSPGNYSLAETTSFPIASPVLIKNSNGEIVALTGTNADVFDNNLNLISSNTIALPIGTSSKIEAYSLPSGYRIAAVANGSNVTNFLYDLDMSFAVIQTSIQSNFNPISRSEFNGKQYVLGFGLQGQQRTAVDGSVPMDNMEVSMILCDDLNSTPTEFLEYNRRLEIGNIEFFANHLGRYFTSKTFDSGFNYKLNGTYRSLAYASSQYTLGKTLAGGDLQGFLSTYGNYGSMVPGPYTTPGLYDHLTEDKYNRGYFVNKAMIEAHITAIGNSDPNYEMPFGIKHWPTNGDVNLGQAATLVDYVDRNSNGVYDPENGDYPSIYGDQCLLNIYHQHPLMAESNSIETHQYFFTFDCNSSDELNNTVFIRQHEFTRANDLTDVYHTTFMDFDIGNPFDDYCGSNVNLGMAYGYNGDPLDEPDNGNPGFNDTIPAFGILTVQGLKLPVSTVDRPVGVNDGESINGLGFGDGIPNNEYYTLESSLVTNSLQAGVEPNNLSSAYEVAQGNNGNGSPQLINTVEVRHSYLESSDPSFYSSVGIDHGNNHSEITENNPPGDRRMYSASGPTKFFVTDTMVLIDAYIVGIDTVNISIDDSRDKLFNHGASIRDMYAMNSTPCGGDFDTYVSDNDASIEELDVHRIKVFPNPANQEIGFDGIQGSASILIFDLNGRKVDEYLNIHDHVNIDISSLDKAVYLISISDQKGTQTIRMIKQ